MKLPTCHELLDFLSDYLADGLPAETRAAFEAHLARCESCRNYLENFRTTLRSAKAAWTESSVAPLPEGLVQAILKSRCELP